MCHTLILFSNCNFSTREVNCCLILFKIICRYFKFFCKAFVIMSTCVYPVCSYFIMIKWAMLWHGFRCSLLTQQLQLVSMYQLHVKIIFGKSTSVCALQEGGSCSFVQRLGRPQALGVVMGVQQTCPPGSKYLSLM